MDGTLRTEYIRFRGFRGFGKGVRDYLSDPSVSRTGRSSPSGESFYASNPFQKTRWEADRSFSMGFFPGCHLDPENIINESLLCSPPILRESVSVRNVAPCGFTLKSRNECQGSRSLSPGPGTYKLPSYVGGPGSIKVSIQSRHMDSKLFNETTSRPGPGAHNTRIECGRHRPAFSIRGRLGSCSRNLTDVGPGEYNITGAFDKYHMEPVNWVPPFSKKRHSSNILHAIYGVYTHVLEFK